MYRRIRFLLPVLFTAIVHLSLALPQPSHKIDSLRDLLAHANTPSERFTILWKIYYEYYAVNDTELGLEYANQCYQAAVESGDSLSISQAINAKGWMLMKKGYMHEALLNFRSSLGIARRNGYAQQAKYVLNNLSMTYTFMSAPDKALEVAFESLKLREESGDPGDISTGLNSVGLIYLNLRDCEDALNFFKKSYQMKVDNNITYALATTLSNMGDAYFGLGRYAEAIRSYQEALQNCHGPDCNQETYVNAIFSLASTNFQKGDLDEAARLGRQCIKLSRQYGVVRFESYGYNLMTTISLHQHDLRAAAGYLQHSDSALLGTDLRDQILQNYQLHADLLTAQDDYRNAVAYLNKYDQLKDSVFHSDLIRNIARIQTAYEERENIKTIATQDQVIHQAHRLNIAITFIALLAGLLIFVLYRTNNVTKRVNQALSDAKEIIEDQNRQLKTINLELEERVRQRTRELSVSNESLIRVNDELDNFIYKTSHDIRGPLASLKGICNVAIMDVKDPVALGYLQKLDLTAERLNGILTRLLIINHINHASLNSAPVDFAGIIDDILFLEQKKGMPRNMSVDHEIEEGIILNSDKEFIRIILENLIDNAIKFYNDSERVKPFVKIRVERAGTAVVVRVIDNGIGINHMNPEKIFQMFTRASERSTTGGIGLYLAKTAADKIGGKVGLSTTPEGYTEFNVTFASLTTTVVKS